MKVNRNSCFLQKWKQLLLERSKKKKKSTALGKQMQRICKMEVALIIIWLKQQVKCPQVHFFVIGYTDIHKRGVLFRWIADI